MWASWRLACLAKLFQRHRLLVENIKKSIEARDLENSLDLRFQFNKFQLTVLLLLFLGVGLLGAADEQLQPGPVLGQLDREAGRGGAGGAGGTAPTKPSTSVSISRTQLPL